MKKGKIVVFALLLVAVMLVRVVSLSADASPAKAKGLQTTYVLKEVWQVDGNQQWKVGNGTLLHGGACGIALYEVEGRAFWDGQEATSYILFPAQATRRSEGRMMFAVGRHVEVGGEDWLYYYMEESFHRGAGWSGAYCYGGYRCGLFFPLEREVWLEIGDVFDPEATPDLVPSNIIFVWPERFSIIKQ